MSHSQAPAGQLYIVATPIGNLNDFTMRAIEVLGHVSVIAAEDTRHSRKLLSHYGIKTPCIALHEHNEREQLHSIAERLRSGQDVALISDAGTPLINDPGYQLVHYCVEHGLQVQPIPGASAVITALSAAGIPCDRFCFEGFVPAKSAARIQAFRNRCHDGASLVYYLSPHRWEDALRDMISVFGEQRQVVLARELTKIHETFHRDTLAGLLQWMSENRQQQKGEMVVIVAAEQRDADELDPRSSQWLSLLLKEMSPSRASALLAEMLGVNKKPLYQLALQLQDVSKK